MNDHQAVSDRHVVVIGGGITGLTAAYRLARATNEEAPPLRITIIESETRFGGKIKTSPFAGLAAIDEGPDAYLARVPHAVALAHDLGLDGSITHPASGHAAIARRGLQRIPDGLLLGVPTGLGRMVGSPLLSWRGKVRAALEPLLPTSPDPHDSIGLFIRQRFGTEVHERLVDPLVGSIYAADTMNFSLAMVPQLSALSTDRSILFAARRAMRANPAPNRPVFDAPVAGMSQLVETLTAALRKLGVTIQGGTTVVGLAKERSTPSGSTMYRLMLDGSSPSEITADAVIVTAPARAAASLIDGLDPEAGALLRTWDHVSVVIVTMRTTESAPRPFQGLSGYLVPKPEQDHVTAVSFGSNKWAHWRPADGSMILRASMGRDGAPVDDLIEHWNDERFVQQVVDEVACHTGVTITPVEHRLTLWPRAFPQYRPGHAALVGSLEQRLASSAPGVILVGASMRGIGIPSCVAQANIAAEVTRRHLSRMV